MRTAPGGEQPREPPSGDDDQARLERLAAIVEHSTDAIVGKTLDGIVTDWNPAAERTYGWEAADAVGRSVEFVFPRDRQDELANILEHLRRGEEFGPYETMRLRKDGSAFPALVTVSPIRDRTKRVIGGSNLALDLSNVRRTQAAEEALRLREQFLASVSHDLQQPLTTIRGQARLLQRWLEPDERMNLEKVVARLRTIETTARHISAQIAGMVDEARLEAGRPLDLECEPTDLLTLARELVLEYAQSTDTHEMRLETNLLALNGMFDPLRLRRLLGNLLSNAVKYSPVGGAVALSVTRENDEHGRSWAVIAVRDGGVGIPAADLPHIFERGFRARNVARGRVHGTGLGLLGAQLVAEQHGGSIEVASREGEGTTVTLRLPV